MRGVGSFHEAVAEGRCVGGVGHLEKVPQPRLEYVIVETVTEGVTHELR